MANKTYGLWDFKVLISEGPCYLKHSGKDSLLKPGKVIFALNKSKETYIYLDSGSYLGLVHKSGRVVELSKAGRYSVSQLNTHLLSDKKLSCAPYSLDLLDKLGLSSSKARSINPRYNNIFIGDGMVYHTPRPCHLLIPDQTHALKEPITIYWKNYFNKAPSYTLELTDPHEDSIYLHQIATDTFANIDFTALPWPEIHHRSKSFTKDSLNSVLILKLSKGGETKPYFVTQLIQYPGGNQEQKLKKEYAQLASELGSENALTNLILANYCEQNKLYLKALELLTAACEMHPEVQDFKLIYNRFLVEHKLAIASKK